MPKLNGLSPKQKAFAKSYLDTGNATQSIIAAGYNIKNMNVAKSMGSENLSKPDIMAFLSSKAKNCASIIYELAQSAENETVRLNASKDILDRSGFKPTDKSEVEVTAPKPLLDAFFNNNSNKEIIDTNEEN